MTQPDKYDFILSIKCSKILADCLLMLRSLMNNFLSCEQNLLDMRWMLIFFLGFAGLCIHAQTNSLFDTEKLHYRLPHVDNTQKATEITPYNQGDSGLKFAFSHKTSLNPKESGKWDKASSDRMIWRQKITSKDAFGISLGFQQFRLTPSSQLLIYNPDRSAMVGPLDSSDNDRHGQFWTPLIPGDEIIIELNIKSDEIEDLIIEIGYVNHDFTGLNSRISGSCNLDVKCSASDGWPEVDPYRDIIRSVGAYFFMDVNDPFPGLSICTGTLINNVREDCTPYFLTAYHCLGGDPANPIEEATPSLVFIWNYENSTCRQPNSPESGGAGDGNFNLFNSGSELRSSNQFTDFILLELDDPVIEIANPFFAGWDATSQLPMSTICVHHPGVEEKRISFDFEESEYRFNSVDTLFLRVNNWEIGTTEGGSSGAPLFNENKQVVGQLFGGLASCSNNSWDNFGWFHRSWEGSGTPDSRLKDWLDPDQSGILRMGGKECSYFVELSEYDIALCTDMRDTLTIETNLSQSFPDSATINIPNLPSGITVTIDKNPVLNDSLTNLILTASSSTVEGQYPLSVRAQKGGIEGYAILNVQIVKDVPNVPILLRPIDEEGDNSTFVYLEWSEDEFSNYSLQISRNVDFSVLDFDEKELAVSSYFAQNLFSNTTYFWRVQAFNDCGTSGWSETFEFTTNDIRCITYNSSDTPLEISSEGPNDIQSEIDIRQSGVVVDVNVLDLIGSHSWLDDLSFILANPTQDSVFLIQNICGPLNNFDIQFDQQEPSSNYPCPYTDGNTYRPLGSLDDFNGQSSRGTWKLIVSDNAQGDGGSLDSWSIDICIDVSNDYSVIPDLDTIKVCGQDIINNTIRIGSAFNGPVVLSAENPMAGLNYNFSSNPTQSDTDIELSISGLNQLPTGIYTLEYKATDGQNESIGSFILDLNNGPGKPALIQPINQQTNVHLLADFSWTAGQMNGSFLFELSLDSIFSQIVVSTSLDSMNLTLENELLEETVYYWRISTTNICGTTFSDVFRFTTTFESKVIELGNESLEIYPNPVSDVLTIKTSGPLFDVGINVYSLRGEKVFSDRIFIEYEHSLILNDLSPGVYIVLISKDQSFISHRLIKI